MSFEVFKAKVNAIIDKTGVNLTVWFSYDNEHEKFYARFSDGTTIIGRPSSKKVTVRYGSGHQMMAAI